MHIFKIYFRNELGEADTTGIWDKMKSRSSERSSRLRLVAHRVTACRNRSYANRAQQPAVVRDVQQGRKRNEREGNSSHGHRPCEHSPTEKLDSLLMIPLSDAAHGRVIQYRRGASCRRLYAFGQHFVRSYNLSVCYA